MACLFFLYASLIKRRILFLLWLFLNAALGAEMPSLHLPKSFGKKYRLSPSQATRLPCLKTLLKSCGFKMRRLFGRARGLIFIRSKLFFFFCGVFEERPCRGESAFWPRTHGFFSACGLIFELNVFSFFVLVL